MRHLPCFLVGLLALGCDEDPGEIVDDPSSETTGPSAETLAAASEAGYDVETL